MHIVTYDRTACEIGAHAGTRNAAWAVMSPLNRAALTLQMTACT